MGHFIYTAYNLTIHSDMLLPELLVGTGTADVIIRTDTVPANLPGCESVASYFQAIENELLLKIAGVAHFWVRNGDEIVIQPLPDSEERDIRVYLLGSCLAGLLHQRGVLALHASTVRTEVGALLFAGHSGSGKSTLLSAFLQRGYEMLADDVCGIILDESGAPVVLPAIPRSKLWADAALGLGIDTTLLPQIYSKENKYGVPMDEQFVMYPLPVARIYLLSPHDGELLTIAPIEGLERISVLLEQTFRGLFLGGLKKRETHLQLAVAVAKHARFYVVNAPRSRFSPHEIAQAIEEDLDCGRPNEANE